MSCVEGVLNGLAGLSVMLGATLIVLLEVESLGAHGNEAAECE